MILRFQLGREFALRLSSIFLLLTFEFMEIAYNYWIKQADHCYSVYIYGILLATITPGEKKSWMVNINGEDYLFIKSGMLKPSVKIRSVKDETDLGIISMPFFSLIFQRSQLLRKDGDKLTWVSKSIFSLHWLWKLNNKIIIEGVEDFSNNGVIRLSGYQQEYYLLIIAGMFLSLRRRRMLLFGLFDVRHKSMKYRQSLA